MLPSPTAAATRFTGLEAHVAAREDPRNARLEKVGIALEAPATGVRNVRPGEHEPARVERDLAR